LEGLGKPWGPLGVSWARLGGVLAGSSWWLGGVLALGAVLGSIVAAFLNRFGIVLMYLGIDFLNFVQKN